MTSSNVILAGWSDDLAVIAPLLTNDRTTIVLVDERGYGAELPTTADVVVFALSRGATYSTQLRIVCNRIFYRVSTKRRFLLPVGDVDLDVRGFPEFDGVPRTTLAELTALIARLAEGEQL